MISFQAKYITTTTIKDRLNNDVQANFVELDPNSKDDKKVLKKITRSWANEHRDLIKNNEIICGESYVANSLYSDFKDAKKRPRGRSFYALTTQSDSFEKLNIQDVVGLTEVERKFVGEYEINYLQTKPNCTRLISNKPYSKVGKNLLKCIEEVLPFRTIEVAPILEISEFYENNGYKCNPTTLQLIRKKLDTKI